MVWRWVHAIVFLLASLWFGNLALFNWWAAGGPPTPHPEQYASRGNFFFVWACLFFVAFVIKIVMNIRRIKRRGKP